MEYGDAGCAAYCDGGRVDRVVQKKTRHREQRDHQERDEQRLGTAHHIVPRAQADRVDVDPEVLVLRS
jgi:hypothetical protein